MRQIIGDEIFYTPEQIAKKLQLSLTTIYNLIKSKEIPAIRVGKCFRIPESELSKSLSEGRKEIPKSAISLVEKIKASQLKSKAVN